MIMLLINKECISWQCGSISVFGQHEGGGKKGREREEGRKEGQEGK